MGFWNFIGKIALFNSIWKQLFGCEKSSEMTGGSSSVRGRYTSSFLASQRDKWQGYNEDVMSEVDDIEDRFDDYESRSYGGSGWHSSYDNFDHDYYSHDYHDCGHDDYFDDHDW